VAAKQSTELAVISNPQDMAESLFVPGGKKVTIEGREFLIDNRSLHNTLVIAEHSPAMRDVFIYDIFADEVKIARCPPWEKPEQFRVHRLSDEDVTRFRCWLEVINVRLGTSDARAVMVAAAKRNVINPPMDYFELIHNGLQDKNGDWIQKPLWDKTPRLDTWLTYYCGADKQNEEYLKLVGSMWLIGAVARIYKPGCKFDTALILEGQQYEGKSEVFRTLSTLGGKEYFCDDRIDFNNKDHLMALQGKLIYEMAELASFRYATDETTKAAVSKQVDRYRPPYGSVVTDRPRMFVIGGSVNPNGGYFKDPTGNRRYWPVLCSKIDLEALKNDTPQLWAEAVARYKSGERYWLLGDEYKLATIEQHYRMEEDALADDIQEKVAEITNNGLSNNGFRTNDILKKLGIEPSKKTNLIANRVRNWLTTHGYKEKRVRIEDAYGDTKQPVLWVRDEPE